MTETTTARARGFRLPTEQLDRIRALATTLSDEYGLKGAWGWYGDYRAPYLATQRGGRLYILGATQSHEHRRVTVDFDDSSSVPTTCDGSVCDLPGSDTVDGGGTYQVNHPVPNLVVRDKASGADRAWNRLRPASEVAIFEVCPEATSPDDPRVYRTDVRGFRSPAADWLATLDADTVLALVDEVTELRARLAGSDA